MDSKPFFEKKFNSSDPFKKPEHKVPNKFKGDGMPKNPYAPKNLLKEVLINPDNKIDKEAYTPKEPKSIFEKRRSGLTPGELKAELKKVPYYKVNMDPKERMSAVEEFEKSHIKGKDVDKYLKKLPHEIFLAPNNKDKSDLSIKTKSDLMRKKRLLEIVRDKKTK